MAELLLPSNWNFFGTSKSSTAPTPSTPQSPVALARTWDVEKDTDALFHANSVDEIKRIEQQTKLDIDRRREDLRQMVGERYRDLIDAADSIVDMKACSEQVRDSVSKMEHLCQKIQQTHFLRGSGGMRGPPTKNACHEVSLQMKLLSETPEKIWLCLEQKSYLKAAQYYLLARHIHTQLGLVGRSDGSSSGAVSNLAMVEKLWHSVISFKDSILECCHGQLECSDVEEGAVVESLCAMVLLEGCSPRQVFAKFLVARKTAIQSVLQLESLRSIKSQVCQLMETLLQSLLQISTIFCRKTAGSSFLLEKLVQFTDKHDTTKSSLINELLPAELVHRLPQSVINFVPTLRSSVMVEIPVRDIHSSTEDWLSTCQSDIETGVGQLLQHITSVKGLAAIRGAVYDLLGRLTPARGGMVVDVEEGGEWEEDWSRVCESVVGRKLCLWEMFLRPLLLKRVQVIIERYSISASQHATSQLDEILSGLVSTPGLYQPDTHSHAFLWQEDQISGGVPSTQTGCGEINTLWLKAKSCTPSVYSFCRSLSVQLDTLIEDVSHYFEKKHPKAPPYSTTTVLPSTATIKPWNKASFPFLLYGDTTTLQSYLQQSTTQCVTRFLQSVTDKVSELQDEMKATNQQGLPTELIDRLLFIGRVCQCLFDCCPSLSLLAAGCRPSQQSTATSSTWYNSRSVNKLHSNRKENDDSKTAIVDMLREKSKLIFMLWAEWCANQFIYHFQDHLVAEMELSSLASTLVWDEITISEEDESGTQISSIIKVPSQASVYVTSLLFAISQEISRVGGHTLDKSIITELSSSIFQGVLKCYRNVLKKSSEQTSSSDTGTSTNMPQQCALQLVFNLKFLANILVAESDTESKELSLLIEELQNFIDPFDLDVFRPYLATNLDRQLMRSTVLLGIFLAVKSSTVSTYKPLVGKQQRGHQEKHIVLPLAPSVGRIPSLPTSSSNTSQSYLTAHKVPPSPLELQPSSFLLQTVTFFHHL